MYHDVPPFQVGNDPPGPLRYKTRPVHPQYCVDVLRFGGPCKGLPHEALCAASPTDCGAGTARAYAAGPCPGCPARVIASAAGPSPRSPSPSSRDVTHHHFNRLFRGLMSLGRRSHGPADVIPHVWRCHCGPERTLSKSVHWLRPVGGRFTPISATNSRPDLVTSRYQNSNSCTPPILRGRGRKKESPIAPRIPAQSYERSYSALRLCTLCCESGGPMSRGRPQRGE